MDSYQAIKFIYHSYVQAQPYIMKGLLDIDKRHPQYCRQLLQRLGLSLNTPPTVSVTGSKGKGSTSALLARIMQAAGRKTGLFTGPHLVDFCERIRIDWEVIPEAELVRRIELIRPEVESIVQTMPRDHYMGPVGTVLAVALTWFRDQQTDFHVLECGRGALVDDVNVIENRWSILTPIMMEHWESLGPTLLDIAANKLAVIKRGQQLCVSHQQQPEVETLLLAMARRFEVPLKLANRDFSATLLQTGLQGSRFKYQSQHRQQEFALPLLGRYQVDNAALAIAMAEEVVPQLTAEQVQTAFDGATWPGRCEIIPGSPPLILDATINGQSAVFLRELLVQTGKPFRLILGVPVDKDWRGVVAALAPLAEQVWFTEAINTSLTFASRQEVVAEAKKYGDRVHWAPNIGQALTDVMAAGDEAVVVAGTQSLLRDAKLEIYYQLGRGNYEKGFDSLRRQ